MIKSLKKEHSEQLFSSLGVGMHTRGPGTRETKARMPQVWAEANQGNIASPS